RPAVFHRPSALGSPAHRVRDLFWYLLQVIPGFDTTKDIGLTASTGSAIKPMAGTLSQSRPALTEDAEGSEASSPTRGSRPPIFPVAGIEPGVVSHIPSFVRKALGKPLLGGRDLAGGRIDHEVGPPLPALESATAAMHEVFVEDYDVPGDALNGNCAAPA